MYEQGDNGDGSDQSADQWKADYLDNAFDRIDKELKKEKKLAQSSQISTKDGPGQPTPASQMLR